VNDIKKIALSIRYYRKLKNLTQKKLADKIFVDANLISHFETGKRTPSIETILNISESLGIDSNMLLKPKIEIWAEKHIDEIINEYLYLESHPNFIRREVHKKSIRYIFYISLKNKKLGACQIIISKQLLYFYDVQHLRYDDSNTIFISLFVAPEWFKKEFAIAMEKYIDLQIKLNIETTFSDIVYSSILTYASPIHKNEREYRDIMRKHFENGFISSNDVSVEEGINLTLEKCGLSKNYQNVKLKKLITK
jgi:transcriptional regulator with XRE-family HTH domain